MQHPRVIGCSTSSCDDIAQQCRRPYRPRDNIVHPLARFFAAALMASDGSIFEWKYLDEIVSQSRLLRNVVEENSSQGDAVSDHPC